MEMIMKKILSSILFICWMLMTFVLTISIIGLALVIEDEWLGMGTELISIIKS